MANLAVARPFQRSSRLLPTTDNTQAIFLLMTAGIILRITASGPLLIHFHFDWTSPSGGLYTKLHPGTDLVLLAFAQWFISSPDRARRYYDRHMSHLAFLAMSVFIVIYEAVNKLPGASTFLDTYVIVGLAMPLLEQCTPAQMKRLCWMVVVVIALNAGLCVFETIRQEGLLTENIDPAMLEYVGGGDFRGQALFDSPLSGSMATELAIFLLIGLRSHFFVKFSLLSLLTLGLLGYGGRVALVATIVGMAGIYAGRLVHDIMARKNVGLAVVGTLLGLVIIPFMGAIVLLFTPIGDRIINTFYVDSSASLRESAWNILGLLGPFNLMFGTPDGELVSRANQVGIYFEAEDVENCWLVLFISLGIVGFTIFLAGFLPLLTHLWKHTSTIGRVSFLVFMVVISTSNSIGRKSNALLVMVVASYGLALREETQDRVPRLSLNTRNAKGRRSA